MFLMTLMLLQDQPRDFAHAQKIAFLEKLTHDLKQERDSIRFDSNGPALGEKR